MCDFHFTRRQRIRVYTETMILRSDFHLFGEQVFDRMIRPMMAEFQLEGFAAQREPAELMAEANPENRHLSDELLNSFNGVANGLGITRSIGEKNAVWFQLEDLFRGGLRRHDPYIAVVIHEQSQDVLLDAVIER